MTMFLYCAWWAIKKLKFMFPFSCTSIVTPLITWNHSHISLQELNNRPTHVFRYKMYNCVSTMTAKLWEEKVIEMNESHQVKTMKSKRRRGEEMQRRASFCRISAREMIQTECPPIFIEYCQINNCRCANQHIADVAFQSYSILCKSCIARFTT